MSDHLPPSSELPTPPSGTPVPHDPVSPLTQQPAPSPPLLSHPQIIAALITGMISIVVAVVGILPALMDSDNQTPTPTVSVAALVSPTNEPPLPTVVPTGQPAAAVTALPVLPITPVAGETIPPTGAGSMQPPNAVLVWDQDAFNVVNESGGRMSLTRVRFRAINDRQIRWRAEDWGPVHETLPDGHCLRLRDTAAGPRNPPPECAGSRLYAMLEVAASVIFWPGGFTVERDGAVLATCTSSPCAVYVSP
ncbi:MAG: hypothetical protein IT298_07920 [Chloroflexi bacterium]|nr:hypothetical protein [Chloroflexota bacterium]MBV6437126.1 hypothetical protein [Anaerolineae bacterium]MDL1915489.1 hypothetical protein [Anaerolineae bacterium CFX4]OQY86242.1 MAG: hypothetical protein B6D42_01635 [Anaerolineae bacterium UTCFX5]MCC6565672.1 hypothetical protein [Chloroflexota bacterium]